MQDVEDFVSELIGEEKVIVKRLRSLILDTDPRIQEKLSYGVPYFFHHRRICFLWPISHLPCGYPQPGNESEKVTFGFCYGNLLSNEHGLLLQEKRKQVSVIKIFSAKEINEKAFQEIIQEAILIDDDLGKKKKKH